MRTIIITAVAWSLAAVPAWAQTASSTHRTRSLTSGQHVPTGSTGGKPGTANSANPAPNVPPPQTPQAPVKVP